MLVKPIPNCKELPFARANGVIFEIHGAPQMNLIWTLKQYHNRQKPFCIIVKTGKYMGFLFFVKVNTFKTLHYSQDEM